MESALFSLFGEIFRPVWRFLTLWRSQMRFGQNVLRMTWKERFVQFLWKAHCFLFLERIWGQCDDFDKFDAHKCDLAKTCSAWPEKSVLYNFHGKRTVFPFCREFQASVTILRTLTLTNAIWQKRAAHDLKRAFCTIFMESALFSLFGENLRPVWRVWELWRSKMRFGQNVLRMTWKERFVQFSWKAHCFPVLQRIWGQCDDFENFDAHKCDLAKTCCSWPKKRVLYNFHGKRTVFPFSRDLRSVWRFWQIWPSQMRFGQNVLRMTWKEGFVQFLWKAHCFLVLERIWGQCDDFDNFDPHKCDLAKTCCAWPETSVLYNFYRKPHCFPLLARISGQCDHFENFDAQKCDLAKTCCAWPIKNVLYNFIGKRTVFAFLPFRREFETSVTIFRRLTLKNAILPNRAAHDLKRGFCTIFIISALFLPFWRDFQASVTIFNTLTLTNAIWPKRPPHHLKRGFCTIFMESALFSRSEENFRPVWRFWQLWRSKMRFGQNVLLMT